MATTPVDLAAVSIRCAWTAGLGIEMANDAATPAGPQVDPFEGGPATPRFPAAA